MNRPKKKNKFQQLCCWGFGCSGVWRRVAWLVFPDVSKKGIAFIFMGLGLKEEWRMTHQTVKMKALRFFLNVGNHQFSATASHVTSVLCCIGLLVRKRECLSPYSYCALLRLCRTGRYRHLVCRGAATGVTAVDSTKSDSSIVLSEYCELGNFVWLYIL